MIYSLINLIYIIYIMFQDNVSIDNNLKGLILILVYNLWVIGTRGSNGIMGTILKFVKRNKNKKQSLKDSLAQKIEKENKE